MALLDPYRVLDLTGERGLLAGRILADLGADVIQVEPPGGSPARGLAPFADDGSSLYWAAYAHNKRGITCDLDDPAGQTLLRRLVETADFLIESEDPGRMAARGLAYEDVRAVNPALVYVSITPFGATGPKAGYADAEIVMWAAGGPLYPNVEADLPPVRVSVPQAYLHAGADAAAGALIAHLERARSGAGQHVEVSVQVSAAQATLSMVLAAAVADDVDLMNPYVLDPTKAMDLSGSGSMTRRSKWRLADGLAELHLAMGPAAGGATNAFFAWLHDEGACSDELAALDWRQVPDLLVSGVLTVDDIERVRDVVQAFLEQRTKAEVMETAMTRRLAMSPINTVADLVASEHLAERDYFRSATVGGDATVIPGPFALMTVDAFAHRRDAPAVGADNDAVYGELLGAGQDELAALVAEGAI